MNNHARNCSNAKELLIILRRENPETWNHSLRVEYYCRTFAQKIGLADHELKQLSLLACFHDIGKLEISRNILLKREKLTPHEWEEMKTHAPRGCRIAAEMPEIQEIAEYILCHHEHWDGSGYPKGLRKYEIPYLCRILSVSDAFDAMTTDRCYRKSINREDAVCELTRNADKQFDPDIVKLFIESGIPSVLTDIRYPPDTEYCTVK